MGILTPSATAQPHPSGTRVDLQVGSNPADVISVMETSHVVHTDRNHIAVSDLLANGACRVKRPTYHPSDWILVLPSGTCLRMRPATRTDTGGNDPNGLACIDVGAFQPERVPITRETAHWFNVTTTDEIMRVDQATSSRLNDAGITVEDHLSHLTSRG